MLWQPQRIIVPASPAITYSQASGTFFPVGTTQVTATATDAAGNTSSCTFNVSVTDNEPPLVNCPLPIVENSDPGQCGAVVTFSAAANDNCPGATIIYSHISGSFFPAGVTTVTATATDASGNTASCQFTITVLDNIAPSVICPANITVNATAGQCGAAVTYNATTNDNCSGSSTITYSHEPGSFFQVGETTVTVIASDNNGNSATCQFTVTVVDNQAPVISCPSNITVNNDPGQCEAVVDFVVTATDNCTALPVTIEYDIEPGSPFPVGTTTVTATATDAAGNSSSCSFTITVIDNEAPVPVLASLPTITGTCSVTVTEAPLANDNCDDLTGVPNGPLTFNTPGTFTITWTYTDAAGNSSTQTQTVVVNNNPGVINSGPVSAIKCVGQSATFSVSASGTGYQWQVNTGSGWNNIGGATTNSINIPSVTLAMNGYQYHVIVFGTCGNVTSDPATLTVNALPAVFTVTGGGAFCSGPGVPVGLNGSQSGVNYQLLRNGSNTGSPVAGTGAAISFGNQNVNGTYTVVATNTTTTCSNTMTGSVAVSGGAAPTTFNVTSAGTFICGGIGPVVSLSGSQSGVNYQLRRTTFSGTVNVGSPVAGTGSAINFGNQNIAGLYTVVATNPTSGCTGNMSGSALLVAGSVPNVYNVTGGGVVCGTGVTVGLSNSQFLVQYQLLRNGSPLGGAVNGNGGAISFGSQTLAGTYTVIANW